MSQQITVYHPTFQKWRKVSVRRVNHDPKRCEGLPKCAWCRMREIQPLMDITQHGFTIDLVQTVGWCSYCEKATILVYEIELETEREVK